MDSESELAALYEDFSIPYVVVIYSVEKPDGSWLRRAEYPELPDCAAEAESATTALALLEEERARVIFELHQRGEAAPRPRPPLRAGVSRAPLQELLARVLLDSRDDER